MFVLALAGAIIGIVSALILGLCPKRWFVHSDVAARVYRSTPTPPWQVLTRLGKAVTVGVYLGAGVTMAALALGLMFEPGR